MWKHKELEGKIAALPEAYHTPLSQIEEDLHALPVSQLVHACKSGDTRLSEVMLAYGKKTLQAHKLSNCLADVMFDEALEIAMAADEQLWTDDDKSTDRPFLGVPISLKGQIEYFD